MRTPNGIEIVTTLSGVSGTAPAASGQRSARVVAPPGAVEATVIAIVPVAAVVLVDRREVVVGRAVDEGGLAEAGVVVVGGGLVEVNT